MSRKPVHLGYEKTTPLVLGPADGSPPRYVEGTGLYLAVRKGERRWVTGAAVAGGLIRGSLIQVLDPTSPQVSAPTQPQAAAAEVMDTVFEPPVPPDADLGALATHAPPPGERFVESSTAVTVADGSTVVAATDDEDDAAREARNKARRDRRAAAKAKK